MLVQWPSYPLSHLPSTLMLFLIAGFPKCQCGRTPWMPPRPSVGALSQLSSRRFSFSPGPACLEVCVGLSRACQDLSEGCVRVFFLLDPVSTCGATVGCLSAWRGYKVNVQKDVESRGLGAAESPAGSRKPTPRPLQVTSNKGPRNSLFKGFSWGWGERKSPLRPYCSLFSVSEG